MHATGNADHIRKTTRGDMSLRKVVIAAAVVLSASAAAPTKASADWLLTPFLGSTFGGNADVADVSGSTFSDEFEQKLNYGASLAWMGAGVVGFEFDFGYSPNFFGVNSSNAGFDLVGDGNVTTAMGNVIVGAPLGGVRPYASGGLGLIASRVDNPSQFFTKATSNDLGMDVGGGVMFLGGNVGVRGDLRYFRSLSNNDSNGVDLSLGSFNFWRGSVGVTFKF
jgi:hypothetical protein